MAKREIIIEGDIAVIPLTRGYTAIIDAKDAGLACGSWFASGSAPNIYATKYDASVYSRLGDRACSAVKLHRLLMGSPEAMVVDHINGDRMDNRRCNLRIVTHAQNAKNRTISKNNTSGCLGVYWDSFEGRWEAKIQIDGEEIRLGRFLSFDEAKVARRLAEIKFYGEFARAS